MPIVTSGEADGKGTPYVCFEHHKQLLDGKLPKDASGPAPSKEEEKLEKEEAAALKASEKAAEKQKSADEAAVKANGDFIEHVESALNKGPEGSSGSGAAGESGASGSA